MVRVRYGDPSSPDAHLSFLPQNSFLDSTAHKTRKHRKKTGSLCEEYNATRRPGASSPSRAMDEYSSPALRRSKERMKERESFMKKYDAASSPAGRETGKKEEQSGSATPTTPRTKKLWDWTSPVESSDLESRDERSHFSFDYDRSTAPASERGEYHALNFGSVEDSNSPVWDAVRIGRELRRDVAKKAKSEMSEMEQSTAIMRRRIQHYSPLPTKKGETRVVIYANTEARGLSGVRSNNYGSNDGERCSIKEDDHDDDDSNVNMGIELRLTETQSREDMSSKFKTPIKKPMDDDDDDDGYGYGKPARVSSGKKKESGTRGARSRGDVDGIDSLLNKFQIARRKSLSPMRTRGGNKPAAASKQGEAKRVTSYRDINRDDDDIQDGENHSAPSNSNKNDGACRYTESGPGDARLQRIKELSMEQVGHRQRSRSLLPPSSPSADEEGAWEKKTYESIDMVASKANLSPMWTRGGNQPAAASKQGEAKRVTSYRDINRDDDYSQDGENHSAPYSSNKNDGACRYAESGPGDARLQRIKELSMEHVNHRKRSRSLRPPSSPSADEEGAQEKKTYESVERVTYKANLSPIWTRDGNQPAVASKQGEAKRVTSYRDINRDDDDSQDGENHSTPSSSKKNDDTSHYAESGPGDARLQRIKELSKEHFDRHQRSRSPLTPSSPSADEEGAHEKKTYESVERVMDKTNRLDIDEWWAEQKRHQQRLKESSEERLDNWWKEQRIKNEAGKDRRSTVKPFDELEGEPTLNDDLPSRHERCDESDVLALPSAEPGPGASTMRSLTARAREESATAFTPSSFVSNWSSQPRMMDAQDSNESSSDGEGGRSRRSNVTTRTSNSKRKIGPPCPETPHGKPLISKTSAISSGRNINRWMDGAAVAAKKSYETPLEDGASAALPARNVKSKQYEYESDEDGRDRFAAATSRRDASDGDGYSSSNREERTPPKPLSSVIKLSRDAPSAVASVLSDDTTCRSLHEDSDYARCQSVAQSALAVLLSRIEEAEGNFSEALRQGDIGRQAELAGLMTRLGQAAVTMRKLEQV